MLPTVIIRWLEVAILTPQVYFSCFSCFETQKFENKLIYQRFDGIKEMMKISKITKQMCNHYLIILLYQPTIVASGYLTASCTVNCSEFIWIWLYLRSSGLNHFKCTCESSCQCYDALNLEINMNTKQNVHINLKTNVH